MRDARAKIKLIRQYSPKRNTLLSTVCVSLCWEKHKKPEHDDDDVVVVVVTCRKVKAKEREKNNNNIQNQTKQQWYIGVTLVSRSKYNAILWSNDVMICRLFFHLSVFPAFKRIYNVCACVEFLESILTKAATAAAATALSYRFRINDQDKRNEWQWIMFSNSLTVVIAIVAAIVVGLEESAITINIVPALSISTGTIFIHNAKQN